MGNVNRYLAPTPEEVAAIRNDVLRLRTCGLQGHSALFHGHAESLVMLLDLYQAAVAFLGGDGPMACPGCRQHRGTSHDQACWVQELVRECSAAGAAEGG